MGWIDRKEGVWLIASPTNHSFAQTTDERINTANAGAEIRIEYIKLFNSRLYTKRGFDHRYDLNLA